MKFTTANYKSKDYNEDHEIYVGTQTGSFKKLELTNDNPYSQLNLELISKLKKGANILTLNWGDAEHKEILIGRQNNFVKVYNTSLCEFTTNLEMIGPIVGLGRFNGAIVAGISNGNVQIFRHSPEPTIIKTGDAMNKMRQCPVDTNIIGTGGKEKQNNFKIVDLTSQEIIFKTKNLPNDMLQLEVPIWDNDFDFFDKNCVATCSRYGYIRYYDTRQQRRPVQMHQHKEQISYTSLALDRTNKIIYTGISTGGVFSYDLRFMKNVLHTYKGYTGSVTNLTLDNSYKYLVSSSLDRYVRVHDCNTKELLYQNYVKSKATSVLIKNINGKSNEDDDECIMLNETNTATQPDDEYDELFDKMQTIEEEEIEIANKRKKLKTETDVNTSTTSNKKMKNKLKLKNKKKLKQKQ